MLVRKINKFLRKILKISHNLYLKFQSFLKIKTITKSKKLLSFNRRIKSKDTSIINTSKMLPMTKKLSKKNVSKLNNLSKMVSNSLRLMNHNKKIKKNKLLARNKYWKKMKLFSKIALNRLLKKKIIKSLATLRILTNQKHKKLRCFKNKLKNHHRNNNYLLQLSSPLHHINLQKNKPSTILQNNISN